MPQRGVSIGAAAENTIIGVTGAKADQNPDFLKEMIRTQIERYQFIGSQGGMQYIHANELTPIDKINLIKMGIGRGVLEKETEQKLMAELPSLENELKDE